MRRRTLALFTVVTLWPLSSFGWGESGHQIIARLASKLAALHPDLKEIKEPESRRAMEQFLKLLKDRRYQQGNLANIPDTHWRNLESPLTAAGNQLGSPTHFLDGEFLAAEGSKDPFGETKVPLDYEGAKLALGTLHPNVSLFKTIGTAPWRAQQFTTLWRSALEGYPKQSCETLDSREDHPTRTALAYAGLLAHFTGDAAMPLHSTKDHDGMATGQKGIHWYFENDLVDALEPGLEAKVEALAEKILTGNAKDKTSLAARWKKIHEKHPDLKRDDQTTALVFSELADSHGQVKKLRDLDLKYSVSTAEEALALEACRPTVSALMAELEKTPSKTKRRELLKQKAASPKDSDQAPCRRLPKALVDWGGFTCAVAGPGCKSVAAWHEGFIVERLALAAALTADVWVRTWKEAGTPYLCATFKYALKPSFVSPTDGACFGYARNESPEEVLKPSKPLSPLWRTSAKSAFDCVKF